MQPASLKITIRDCIMRRFSKVASPTWQALCQVEDGEISKGKALEIIREECERMERENFPELIAERDTALAKVKELEAQSAWRPIESAPKDGTRILYCDAEGNIYAGCWDAKLHSTWSDETNRMEYSGGWTDHGVASFGYEEYTEQSPTHWQPLPPPPAAADSQGTEGKV